MTPSGESPSSRQRLPRLAGVLVPGGRARLITEVFAGITLAALALPLNIGYAEAAGLPVIVGINAAILQVPEIHRRCFFDASVGWTGVGSVAA